MALNIIALALTAIISIVLPLVLVGMIWFKKNSERKEIVLLFLAGAGVYLAMEWGIKVQGLKFLFNHTSFAEFTSAHYIPYLFLVAIVGAVLTIIPEFLIVRFFCKNQMSFTKTVSIALGYAMAEAVILVGYRSILTIIEFIKNGEQELDVPVTELFLSGYERILIMVIRVSLMAVLVYFMEQKKTAFGVLIKVFCYTLVSFLPGFFIAFSTVNYYEVYDRNVALILVYVVLTVAAITAAVVLNSLKYSFKDEG